MDKKKLLVQEWLKKAEHDLGMAKLALEYKEEYTDSICFHCQQYVEKTLKAYLIQQDIEFAKTHSLSYLVDLMGQKKKVSEELYSLVEELESYSVEIRYPGDGYEPTKGDAVKAYENALKVRQIIHTKLRSNVIERQVDGKKDRNHSHEFEI